MPSPNSKRALLLTDVTAPGGVDTYVCGLYETATRLGWEVTVAIDEHPGSDRLADMLNALSAPLLRAPFYHREHDESTRERATRQAIEVARADLVHAVCGAPWTTVLPRETALACGLPLIFTEQYVAPDIYFAPELIDRIRAIYQKAHTVIAVSKNNQRLLTETYGLRGNLVVIPNPASAEPIAQYSDSRRREILKNLDLPERRWQALTVARCVPQKGIDILIEAIALLPDEKRRLIHFAVAGDGPDLGDLKNKALELGHKNDISFLGWQAQVRELLPAFDLFVLPSRSEGQPFALAEALSIKLPVIASAVAGIPEMLDDGKGGDLVPSESPLELAQAIGRFIDQPETLQAKAAYGQDYVRRHHNVEKNLMRTIRIWELV